MLQLQALEIASENNVSKYVQQVRGRSCSNEDTVTACAPGRVKVNKRQQNQSQWQQRMVSKCSKQLELWVYQTYTTLIKSVFS